MKPTFGHILDCFATGQNVKENFRAKEQSRLLFCMIVTGLMMFIEFFGGLRTQSLALLSDSAHMFSHLFSLGTSFIAILIAKKAADAVRSYGFYRAEILAAFFNGVTLILIVIWIIYDAVLRLIHPLPVAIPQMLLIAVIGLAVNITTAFILKNVSEHDLNVKSAFFHMLADTASSIGIIIAGFVIMATGYVWLDPAVSILIAVMILIWAIQLFKEAAHILLESTPRHLSSNEITTFLKEKLPQIDDIHHIHIWELTSGVTALTAHVVIEDCKISDSEDLRKNINTLLTQKFQISHTNLQFESKK